MNLWKFRPYNYQTPKIIGIILGLTFSLSQCTRIRRQSDDSSPPWPEGFYGLPMVKSSRCPSSKGFTWATGSRFHNTPVASKSSSTFHLASIVNNDGVDQRFCIKEVNANDTLRPSWPKGRYCIYKKGPSCPYGLSDGWVFWDDDNKSNNNSQDGSVPSGTFDQNTKIFFCCQTVGNVFEAIYLPVDNPFYLITFKSLFSPNIATCQGVHGAVASIEYIKFGTQQSSAARVGGRFPFGADGDPQYIYYCYYSKCEWRLTNNQGLFSTPNYPASYRNNLDCTWSIAVPIGKIAVLQFDVFELETTSDCVTADCPCDYIDVIDYFANGLPSFRGRYCMGVNNTPPVIRSTADNLTVLFHSDTSRAGKGFKASYYLTALEESTTSPSVTNSTSTESRTTSIPSSVPQTTPITPTTRKANDTEEVEEMKPIPLMVPYVFAAMTVCELLFVFVVLCIVRCKGSSNSRDEVKFIPVANVYDQSPPSKYDNQKEESEIHILTTNSWKKGESRISPSAIRRKEKEAELLNEEDC